MSGPTPRRVPFRVRRGWLPSLLSLRPTPPERDLGLTLAFCTVFVPRFPRETRGRNWPSAQGLHRTPRKRRGLHPGALRRLCTAPPERGTVQGQTLRWLISHGAWQHKSMSPVLRRLSAASEEVAENIPGHDRRNLLILAVHGSSGVNSRGSRFAPHSRRRAVRIRAPRQA